MLAGKITAINWAKLIFSEQIQPNFLLLSLKNQIEHIGD